MVSTHGCWHPVADVFVVPGIVHSPARSPCPIEGRCQVHTSSRRFRIDLDRAPDTPQCIARLGEVREIPVSESALIPWPDRAEFQQVGHQRREFGVCRSVIENARKPVIDRPACEHKARIG